MPEPMPAPAPAPAPAMIPAPIFSNQRVYIKQVAGNINRAQVPTIVVESGAVPINMLFKTSSADLNVNQQHDNAAPQVQSSSSVDGTVVLKHSVKKPVVQYVNEVIVPSRYLNQKVMPVKEYVKTVVTKQMAAPEPMPAPAPAPAPAPEPMPTKAPAPAPMPEPEYKPYYGSLEEYTA